MKYWNVGKISSQFVILSNIIWMYILLSSNAFDIRCILLFALYNNDKNVNEIL